MRVSGAFCSFGRWLVASTLLGPVLAVVLGVRHHPQDIHFVARVKDPGDKAVFVASEVQDRTGSHQIG